jgi:hypothetical protein
MTEPTDADEMRACLQDIGWSSSGMSPRAGGHGPTARRTLNGHREILLALGELIREWRTFPAAPGAPPAFRIAEGANGTAPRAEPPAAHDLFSSAAPA